MQKNNIDTTIFRAYDIRGIVDKTLTVEAVEAVGKAVASMVLRCDGNELIVARDGRLSSPKLFDALTKGIMSTGCHVIDIGVVTTPILYFATNILSANSGIMITGSHNPPDYNGLKVVVDGKTLTSDGIQKICRCIETGDFVEGQGTMRATDVMSSYVDRICKDVHVDRPLKVVLDCGNGVGGVVVGQLFRALGCEVEELFCDVDGTFPNHYPDPSVVENLEDLSRAVVDHHADVGLAFDGDADRLGVVTNKGKVIFSDRVVMLLAADVLTREPGATIVYDVKCTHFLKSVISERGGVPLMVKTGHSNVKKSIIDQHAALGGELSGHIFFKERWYGFDDAVYSGARLVEILGKSKQTLDDLFNEFPDSINTPELRLPIGDEEKFKFMDEFKAKAKFEDANIVTIDGLRVEFQDGWGLLRPSNTTPNLIMRFEANDENAMKRIQEVFRKELLALNSNLELPF